MQKEKPNSNWRRVIHYYWPHALRYKKSFILAFSGYTIAVFLENALAPYFYKNIVDSISNFSSSGTKILPTADSLVGQEVIYYALLISLIFILNRLFYTVADYAFYYFNYKGQRDVTNFAFKKIIEHSYQFFINAFAGSLVKKTGRFSNSFEDINDIFLYNIWLPVIRLLSVFIVLFLVAPIIGVIYFVWAIIFIIISWSLAKKRIPLDLAEANADSNTGARTADVFSGVLNLKMFSSKDREISSFNDITTLQMISRKNSWNFQAKTFIIQGSFVTLLQIGSLFISLFLWFKGQITLGTIVLAYTYSSTIFDNVWNLGKQLTRLSKSFSNAAEMVDILDLPIEITDPKNKELLKMKMGKVSFENVVFQYKKGNTILNNFNLEIKAGERVGIVGTSGAGKTTITKILLRFVDVTGGSIKIDDQDIRKVTQDDLRKVISYVPQDPILFHRTLLENISYGMPDATEEEIVSASKQAHAHEFIEGLPLKYETLVGERGIKLSGGERQRVAIARAILKNSPILILDEATSSLDSVSETHIKEALDRLMEGRTTIVVAHRLSTIEKMDRIIVMEKGKIVEEGKHSELLKKKGVYSNFWNHQTGGFLG